jgi:hypothetical protein
MNKESKRKSLINLLKKITPEMQAHLETLKQESKMLDRADFVWHFLLQSFATMGNSRGRDGLINDKTNYNQITFEALTKLNDNERLAVLNRVLKQAKVRMPKQKAHWLNLNYQLIVDLGGLEQARQKALDEVGTEAKIAFMKRFHGIGDKYARNIWMDVYHPDFHHSVAIDQRIKRITQELGYRFSIYKEHEGFYQEMAKEAKLQAWELDRILYNYRDKLLADLGNQKLLNNKSQTIQKMCDALFAGDRSGASQISRQEFPFVIQPLSHRKYTELESTRIFIRDGFIDRYSGDRLVFPGVLRLLTRLLPEEFPFHPNWKMSECHIAYWELSPTIDHVLPIARGGTDDETNWVTTSMLRNSAKANWTLEELEWKLFPAGDFNQWDGMIKWFLEYLHRDPGHLSENPIKRWYNAAFRATANR